MRIAGITYPDVNNGEGCRVTLWVQGCPHHCPMCHNRHTWDFDGGQEFTEEDRNDLFSVLERSFIAGLTISGGEPLSQFRDVLNLCIQVKERFPNKDIWLWTGYRMEDIVLDKEEILDYVDVVVDGKFEYDKKVTDLPWRGSSNQNVYRKVDKDTWKAD